MTPHPKSDFTRTHAHSDDPSTSKEAAASAETSAKSIAETVLRKLVEVGRPMAVEEIVERLPDHGHYQVARRVSDLKKAGKIEPSTLTHRNRNGRKATMWRVVTQDGGE